MTTNKDVYVQDIADTLYDYAKACKYSLPKAAALAIAQQTLDNLETALAPKVALKVVVVHFNCDGRKTTCGRYIADIIASKPGNAAKWKQKTMNVTTLNSKVTCKRCQKGLYL